MRKQFTFFACLMFAISFVGYPQSNNDTESLSEWAEIYQITLESYLKQDTALNANIDFIAIDLATLVSRITRTNNEILISGSKYRSAEGANGFRTTWRLNNGIWEFAGTVMTWIS
jgi:hypothetical protein